MYGVSLFETEGIIFFLGTSKIKSNETNRGNCTITCSIIELLLILVFVTIRFILVHYDLP